MFDPPISTTLDEAPLTPPPQGITFGQSTHKGRLRRDNEDHLAVAADMGLFIVTDGVGGGPGGAVAARLATASLLHTLRRRSVGVERPADPIPDAPSRDSPTPAESRRAQLVAAALQAHDMICQHSNRYGFPGAATTMAALWVSQRRVHVANTGDSRVYRLVGGGLEQLTRDHTLVQELMEVHGALSQQWVQRLGHVVTQVLGGSRERSPTVYTTVRPILGPEVFILCSDGLTNMLTDPQIAAVVESASSPQEAADRLVELANEAGGLDNITVIVVRVQPGTGFDEPS